MKLPGLVAVAGSFAMALTLVSCDSSSPPPSTSDPSGNGDRISGNERLGWNQNAGDAGELGTFRYAAYLDTNTRVELTDVSCGGASGSPFQCNSRMPTMAPGGHTIELVSFVVDNGNVIESGRSAILRVTVTGVMTGGASSTPVPAQPTSLVTTSDGIELRMDVLTEQLESPTAIAVAPDGRVFVAERAGRVRVLRNGALEPQPAAVIYEVLTTAASEGGLLALALDAPFDRTHFVYVAYTMSATQGTRQFRVARYREVDGRLGERVVLLDGIPAAPRPAVSLGTGPDGRLYVAFDAGSGNGRGPTLASYSGKVVRLNTDGTAPQDQPAGSPVIAADLQSPRGLDWHPETGALWIADAKRSDLEELRIVATGGAASNGGRGRLSLPRGTGPAAIAFYRGTLLPGLSTDLLVASEDARHLLRLHFDKHNSTRVATSERLLQDSKGPIQAVATSGDGTIFVATDRALIRFGPR